MSKASTKKNGAHGAPATRLAEIPQNKSTLFKQRISNIKREYGYLFLAALIPAIIFFLIYLARGLYPFGNGTVLVLDLNGQYVYFFEALRDTVLEGGSLLYSWSRSLGGEFLGIYAYYIASPLSYLICLFPDTKIQEFLLIMFMIKAAICGFTMGFYLHKHSVNKNKLAVIAFSVLYAMSAYCVVQQNNTMWIDAVMWLPLVAYGVEQIVKYGKYKMFVIFLALTVASNFYIGYMCCIFVFLYYFFYMLAYKDNNVNNPCLEKAHWGKSLIRMGFFSVIAIGIAAVIVLGAYYSLQFGKNEFTDPSWEITMRFDFFDFLFKLLPSSYDTVRIDGLPFVYCGLLTVILAPLFFCSKKFTVREKIVSGAFLMIFVLSFMISVVDLVWHGFQKPQWLNNRYSFMFCFFLIFLAFRAFEAIEEFSAKHIAAVSAFIFFFVVILQNFAEEYKDKLVSLSYGPKAEDFEVHEFATVLLTVVCLIIYISIIAVMKRAKNTDLVAAVLVCVVCVEAFLSGLYNINDLDEDVGYTRYKNYNEYHNMIRPVTETLLDDYDTSFYRAEKTYHRKTNDNMALKLRGLSNSTSTLNKDTINFLESMGYLSSSHRSQYLGGNPVGDALLGLKYIISERDLSGIYGSSVLDAEDYAAHEGMTVDELRDATFADEHKDMSAEDFGVYLNKWALSLAFAADDAIFDVNFKDQNSWVKPDDERYNLDGYTSPFTRLNALITAILGEDETVEVFKPAIQNGDPEVNGATATVSSEHNKYVNDDSHKYQSSSKKGSGTVTYTYTVPEGVQLYLFFPAYYSREIKISSETMPIFEAPTEGSGKGTVTLSKCDERIVELGFTESSEYKLTVTIINDANQFYTKLDDSFIYYVDTKAMDEAFSRIKANQLVIDENYKEDDIRGTIKTDKNNQTVMTTIPYDEGWHIYVDGKKVETAEALDSLITFEIENAGQHNVRMVYRSTAFTVGIIITVASLAGFILIIIFEDKLKRLAIVRYFCVQNHEEDQMIGEYNKK
jgi:uncharacterized membrane protein YfhO